MCPSCLVSKRPPLYYTNALTKFLPVYKLHSFPRISSHLNHCGQPLFHRLIHIPHIDMLLSPIVSANQDGLILPFLSRAINDFFSVNALQAAVTRTSSSNGTIITIRYSPTLLSLHNVFQCGLMLISMADH